MDCSGMSFIIGKYPGIVSMVTEHPELKAAALKHLSAINE
jgi:hypothetical protein